MNEYTLLEEMRAGVEYKFQIKCRSLSFWVRPLSNLETIRAHQSAGRRLEELPDNDRTEQTASLFLASETLKLASSSDIGANDSPLTDHYLERMTPDELRYLFKEYLRVVDRVNPSLDEMPLEELTSLIDSVKKSPDGKLALIELSFSDLVSISHHLLNRAD